MRKAIIYKFGGASVKNAQAIKNLSIILFNRLQAPMVIVVSAIGKTTNALEEIVEKRWKNEDYHEPLLTLRQTHLAICRDLFPQEDLIHGAIHNVFLNLQRELEPSIDKDNYDEMYDRLIGYGELLSSKIIQAYLCHEKLYCIWQDARELILTDQSFRAARVLWEDTNLAIQRQLLPKMKQLPIVTQGFVGASKSGKRTTLGREGSDFSAAIFASCLDAREVTIWKDVPGVLNADPKLFHDALLFDELDYKEAAEMTYYGASVIHPRTIKPLANKEIPLRVRSFVDQDLKGTLIHHIEGFHNHTPIYTVKKGQLLVTLEVTDFTFINQQQLLEVYQSLHRLGLRTNLLQTSAISISISMDDDRIKRERFLEEMSLHFKIRYNEGLQLVTVKHYREEAKAQFEAWGEIILEQWTRSTMQLVIKAK
ncbi:aspartokinase [Echinicola pacifica]|uniref:Aspartokinase n=1 Tax=Echinicola pacifica TaxID=346377 RepID=A0A918Q141_9BACT|nr:aspartate kinase [Echinicola pacifica]GGZ29477.1 aspartokinase [Echinicola pacifica]